MKSNSPAMTGGVYILLAALLWSTSGIFTRAIAGPQMIVVTLRAASAGLALAPFIKIKEIPWDRTLLNLVLSSAFTSTTFLLGMQMTSAANAVGLHYTAPLWIYLWTVSRTRHVSWRQLLPMGILLSGVITCLFEPSDGSNQLGNFIALISGMGFAWLTVSISNLKGGNNLGLISISNLCSLPVLFLLIPGDAFSQFAALTLEQWVIGVCFGVFQLGISFTFFFKGMKSVNPQKATILSLAELIFTPIWVFLFIGEVPSIYGGICWILILAGLICETILKPKWDDIQPTAKVTA